MLATALADAGLITNRSLPGQGLIYRSYDLFGESAAGIGLARLAARAMKGRSRAAVRAAAESATDQLVELVAPYAPAMIAAHHDAGRRVVLATTTPLDLVEPLARRLGLDDVIATRYQAQPDGQGGERYTGSLDGVFVWAAGKLTAVRRWAVDHDVDLQASWAYSDSVYDLPLLSSVGHPVTVNADARLAVAAALRRWPQVRWDVPPGVPKLLGREPFDLMKAAIRPELVPYAHFDIAGTEHIPRRGPAIVVANHRSYFDAVALALTVARAGRTPRGLAKKELFDAPVIGQLARLTGQILVDRQAGAGNALIHAVSALRGGEVVVILPQGTIPRGRAFFEPKLIGRAGAARLAAETGAPVIPVGLWGTERVWARSSRLPNVTNVMHPPTVRVRVGPPVAGLGRESAEAWDADTETIMAAIVDLLPPEARVAREPTEEELVRTMPPGGG